VFAQQPSQSKLLRRRYGNVSQARQNCTNNPALFRATKDYRGKTTFGTLRNGDCLGLNNIICYFQIYFNKTWF